MSATIKAQNDMGVYKVFNSSDLTLFYRVYLWLILDLRRTKDKRTCVHLNYNSSFFIRYSQIPSCVLFPNS